MVSPDVAVVVVDVVAVGFATGFTAVVVAARSIFDSDDLALFVADDVATPICLMLGAANAFVPKIANIAKILVKSFDMDIFPSFVCCFIDNLPFH